MTNARMTPGPAACAPGPIVVKIPPSMVPRPIPMSAGTPSARRKVGAPSSSGRTRESGCTASSRFTNVRRADISPASLVLDHERLQLGHLLHRVAHAFASEAAVLDAAVREVVDAQRRIIVGDHAADLQLLERFG